MAFVLMTQTYKRLLKLKWGLQKLKWLIFDCCRKTNHLRYIWTDPMCPYFSLWPYLNLPCLSSRTHFIVTHCLSSNILCCSGVARAFPGWRAGYPEDQNEEETKGKWGKIEEMFYVRLSFPPRSERLATPLLCWYAFWPLLKEHYNVTWKKK